VNLYSTNSDNIIRDYTTEHSLKLIIKSLLTHFSALYFRNERAEQL